MRIAKFSILLLLLMGMSAASSAVNAADVVSPSVLQGYNLITKKAYSQAISVLSQVVRENPRDAMARRYLAVAYNQTGNSAKAAKQMELVIRLEPGVSSDLALLGDMYLLSGEPALAAARYKEGMALSPESDQCRCGLAKAYLAAGDTVNAKNICIDGLKVCRDTNARKQYVRMLGELRTEKPVALDDRG